MGRKAALQLSVSMIVILIISIVILGFGLTFVRQIYNDAQTAVLEVDQQTQNHIFDLLDRGGRVVNPLNNKDGPRAKMVPYTIGVRNLLDDPENIAGLSGGNRFAVEISPSLVPLGYTKAQAKEWITVVKKPSWAPSVTLNPEMYKYILNNERDVFTFGLYVDKAAPKGTYVFNLQVMYGLGGSGVPNRDYAPIQKVYVNVAG